MKHQRSLRWLGLAAGLLAGAVTAQSLPSLRPAPQPAKPAANMAGPGTGPAVAVTPGSSGLRSGFAPAPTQVLGNAGRSSIVYLESGAGGPAAAEVARSFRQADANGDGILSADEAQQLSILPSSFEEMDSNHDERLTRAEYEAAAAR
jgi:hypothetical protein